MVKGGVHGKGGHAWQRGGHAWDTTRYGNTINERAVRILLECIPVFPFFGFNLSFGLHLVNSHCGYDVMDKITFFIDTSNLTKGI